MVPFELTQHLESQQAESRADETGPPARASAPVTNAAAVAHGVVAALTRQALVESQRHPDGAHPSATGRLSGLTPSGPFAAAPAPPRMRFERRGAQGPLPIASLVAPLVAWALAPPEEPAAERAAWLHQACAHRDIAYANVIEACARALGDRCREDACTDLDVTLGLIRLQALVRWIGAGTDGVCAFVPWRVRVCAAPREPHALGAAIASECFRATGWDVDENPCGSDAGVRGTLASSPCDALVLSLSDAHPRTDRLVALAHTIGAARAADPRLLVYVTGRAFTELAANAADVGADGACASAVDAPRFAMRDLRVRAGAVRAGRVSR